MIGPRISALFLMLVVTLSTLVPSVPAQTVFVPEGSTWKYLDDGSDQGNLGNAWQTEPLDSLNWASGPAELGYGDGDEATVVGYGPDPDNRYITTYFRTSFEVPDPSLYNFLRISLLRDDGAVVYLNGDEVFRSNMPGGDIDYLTLASFAVAGSTEETIFQSIVDAGGLATGTNTLAVEIHQQSATSSDISFDLEMSGLAEVAHPMQKGPRLVYTNTQSEMKVIWQLEVTETSRIEWGDDLSYSLGTVVTNEYGAKHQHTHTVTGLVPSVKYFYRVIANEDTVAGSFRAAPDPASSTLKFMAYGDTRTNPADHELVAEAMTATYTADPEYQTLALVVGDLVYNGNQEADWHAEFFDSSYAGIQAMLADLPFQSCRGNHEEAGVLFSEYFPYPYVNDFYWSYDYGPAHFTVIDQYVDYTPGSAQYAWLEADLAGTTKDWKFICLHEPGWSAGGHANNSDVISYIQPLCRQYGVAIVFAGHNHYYARANGGGIPHITTGGGGAPLYAPNPNFPRIRATAMANHFCKVEIADDVLIMTVRTPTDSLIDSITIANPVGVASHGGGGPPPMVTLQMVCPNPFNPSATIHYSIDRSGPVEIDVYDVLGRRTAMLPVGWKEEGFHQATWNGMTLLGSPAGSGTYFVRLRSGGEEAFQRVTLIR